MKKKIVLACTSVFLLAACSPPLVKTIDKDVQESREELKRLIEQQKTAEPATRFTEQKGPTILIKPLPKAQQEAKEKEWLTNIRITLDPAKNKAINANAILRMFREKGINIATAMPLDAYSYNGFGVTNADAETALIVFLGAMGLDFEIDNQRKLVTVEPIQPKTWMINIGNRRTNFSTGSSTSSTSSTATVTATEAMASTTTASAATTSATNPTSTTTTNGVATSDDFWTSLNNEISKRLTVMVPVGTSSAASSAQNSPIVPALQSAQMFSQDSGQQAASDLFKAQRVGLFSINPETGAITVQAPRYITRNIDQYLTSVQEMYNTSITFEGQIVTVTSTKNRSEGIDWSSFNSISGYTVALQNNILGGTVLTSAGGTTNVVDTLSVNNSNIPGVSTLLGLMSASKKFAAFNAFLSSIGNVKILETPLVTTTSGIPVTFDKKITRYYQKYEQTTAAGSTGSASTATNTIDVPYQTGMTLRINPRYDVTTGLVRAQFSIQRVQEVGSETKVNPITVGNTIQTIQNRVPILASNSNDGEVLLKNNDMIVVGGLSEDNEDNNDNGITGLIDTPLKSVVGKGTRNKSNTTYYFALRVTVNRK